MFTISLLSPAQGQESSRSPTREVRRVEESHASFCTSTTLTIFLLILSFDSLGRFVSRSFFLLALTAEIDPLPHHHAFALSRLIGLLVRDS